MTRAKKKKRLNLLKPELPVFLLFKCFAIAVWPAETWCPVTWGLNSEYHCRSCTHCPVPSITDSLETPTLLELPIALQPAISPPCRDCRCAHPSLLQVQEDVATSSSAASGWPALHPDCWSCDTFYWVLQWEEATQRKRFLLSACKLFLLLIFLEFLFCFFCPIYSNSFLCYLAAQHMDVCHCVCRLTMSGRKCCPILVNTTGSFLILSGS